MSKSSNKTAVVALLAIAGLAVMTPASAADMTGAEITKLVSGNTVYIAFEAGNAATGAGDGMIHYTADGKVSSKFPNGQAWKGVYVIKDNTSCITWEGRPPNPCTRYDKQGETVTLINTADGKPRGKVTKTVAGNPEKL